MKKCGLRLIELIYLQFKISCFKCSFIVSNFVSQTLPGVSIIRRRCPSKLNKYPIGALVDELPNPCRSFGSIVLDLITFILPVLGSGSVNCDEMTSVKSSNDLRASSKLEYFK